MKRISVFFFMCLIVLASGPAWSEVSLPKSGKDSDLSQKHAIASLDDPFVVETDDESARSSLDRISGDIDRGFAPKENTYKSKNHGAHGPLKDQKDETLYN